MTVAEGPPHGGDDGAEATSRRVSRSEAEGTPKGAGASAQRLGP